MSENLYEYFGIPKNATKSQIKRAYRKKAKEQHPDVSRETNSDFNKTINYYKCLIDDNERERYDRTGSYGKKPTEADTVGELTNYFLRACSTVSNLAYSNIVESTRMLIDRDIQQIDNKIYEIERSNTIFSGISERLVCKNKDFDFLGENLKEIIDSNRKAIEVNKERKEFLEEVKKLLDDYSYKSDKEPRIGKLMFMSTMTGTATGY